MRIIECHVENFGKISNKTFIFDQGLNIINEKNGAGKSTLAAFLRVMFYGFGRIHGEAKDKKADREKYMPWQGGVYGGNLVFEYGIGTNNRTKRYRIVRIFGSKEKEDVFELYDAVTNQMSNDFTSNIGQEIFGIDEGSFYRTTFLAQGELTKCVLSGDISAKLGNIVHDTNDINNYETAYNELSNAINKLSMDRKTGEISKLKAEEYRLKEVLRKKEQLLTDKETILNQIFECRINREAVKKQISELGKEVDELERDGNIIAEKLRYRDIVDELKEEMATYEDISGYFEGRIPKKEEVRNYEKKAERFNELREWYSKMSHAEENNYTDEVDYDDEIFTGGFRDESEDREYINEIHKYEKKRSGLNVINIIISLVLIFMGAYLGTFTDKFYYVLTIAGGILLISTIISRNLASRLAIESDENDSEDNSYIRSKKIKKWLKRCKEEMRELDTIINAFLKEVTGDEFEDVYDAMYELVGNYSEFIDIQRQLQRTSKVKKQLEVQYGFTEEDLNNMEQDLREHFTVDSIFNKMNERFNQLTDSSNKITKEIIDKEKKLDEIEAELTELEYDEIRLGEVSSKIEELTRKYQTIVKTRELLAMARDNFNSKYIDLIEEGFYKYYEYVSSGKKFVIDSDMSIFCYEYGRRRDIESLSAGEKNIVYLCMRMALVEAMFDTKEKPFLVFDDPYVNLDKDGIEGGLDFIDQISSEYQVIYFTCHEARC